MKAIFHVRFLSCARMHCAVCGLLGRQCAVGDSGLCCLSASLASWLQQVRNVGAGGLAGRAAQCGGAPDCRRKGCAGRQWSSRLRPSPGADGHFSWLPLPAGQYRLTVETDGSKIEYAQPIELSAAGAAGCAYSLRPRRDHRIRAEGKRSRPRPAAKSFPARPSASCR